MKSGDDHRRVRRAISRHFRPDRVQKLRPGLVDRAHTLVDGFRSEGEVELLKAFAQELPLQTISELLGVGEEHRDTITNLLRNFKLPFLVVPMSDSQLAEVNQAMTEVTEFFSELIAERRKSPGDDLLSKFIEEADKGNLTEGELVANTWGLFAGGYDTTSVATLHAVMTLCEHPDQLERLMNDWSLLPTAVEESLRFHGSGGTSLRILETDVEIGGHNIPRDTPFVIYKVAANRDKSWLPDADTFDIGREATQHFTFGEGVHKCVGLHQAKQTIEVAIEVLFTRLKNVRVLDEEIDWNFDEIPLRNPRSLRIAWDGSVTREEAESAMSRSAASTSEQPSTS